MAESPLTHPPYGGSPLPWWEWAARSVRASDESWIDADIRRAGVDAAAKAAEDLSQDKADKLNGLIGASIYARAGNVRQQGQQFFATPTVQQSIEQIKREHLDREDYNNPDAKPATDIGKFMQSLQVNMAAAGAPEQQAMVWNASGGVTSFINQQADYGHAHYSGRKGWAYIVPK